MGGAEVEPEVVPPEGHPVEMVGFEPVGAEVLLHRGQGRLPVGDGVVEFPGGKILPQRPPEAGERGLLGGHQFQDFRGRQGGGLGAVIVPEVIVPGDIPPEDGPGLPHLSLQEGVADPVPDHHPGALFDILLGRPAGAEVGDDLRTRIYFQVPPGQQGGDEVVGDELPGLVDHHHPVAIAVKDDAGVRPGLPDPPDRLGLVLFQEGVGAVAGESPVRG